MSSSSYIAIFTILLAVIFAIFIFAAQYSKISQQFMPQLKQLGQIIPQAEKATNWKSFQDNQEGLTINYPITYQIQKRQQNATTTDKQEIVKFIPISHTASSTPQGIITIEKQAGQKALAACSQLDPHLTSLKKDSPGIYHYLSDELSAEGLTPQIKNNNFVFYRDWFATSGEKNYSETISYKTSHQQYCYTLSLTLSAPIKHSNKQLLLGNNKKLIITEFLLMLSTLQFVK